jgi:hypothetical protein
MPPFCQLRGKIEKSCLYVLGTIRLAYSLGFYTFVRFTLYVQDFFLAIQNA